MDDTVENSGSHDLIPEDSPPIFKISVGSEDSGLFFIAVADDFKEVVQGLWGQGAEADLVKDKEIWGNELLEDTSVGVVGTALGQAFEQGVKMGEEDGVAFGSRLQPDGIGQVGFAGTGLSDEDDVSVLVNEAAATDFGDHFFVQPGLEVEVVMLKGLELVEFAFDQTLFEDIGLSLGTLILDEHFKKLQVGELLFLSGFIVLL